MIGRLARAALVLVAALGLGGCWPVTERALPSVDAGGPAPFLSVPGRYPTQAQAEAAIDLAIERYGLTTVYASFGPAAAERKPARVALFACKPGFNRPSVNRVEARRGFVHCHADVGDESGRLVGRATMSFYFDGGAWRLASVLERERDAR